VMTCIEDNMNRVDPAHGGGNLKTVGVYSYFNNIFTLACYLMAIFLFRLDKQKWWFYALVIATCMIITMSTGSRQMALGLMLVLLCSFSMYVYKFKWWQVAVIIAGGAFALFLIVSVRKLGWNPYEWKVRLQHLTVNNYFEIFNDLIVNDLNLFILVDIKEGRDAGRTFFLDNNGVPESGMFRVKGELTDEDIDVAHKPSPYRVPGGGGLKIAVIGADTETGRQIAKEALHRHNAITAVVKKNDWPDAHRYTMVESADYSFNAEGFDAVIDAREAAVKVLAGGKESTILPPAELDTVSYREGTYRVVEGAGRYLTAGDLAVAIVDDAENPKGITYGVEFDKAEPEKEDPESMRKRMAMGHVGIGGKVYHLVMDNLGEFVAHFISDSIVYFAKKGEPLKKYHCFCFKSDDQVWSAAFMIDKMSCTLVLDEAQRLVTMVTGITEPARPELVRHDFQFGALRMPGKDLPFMRHAFTDDLVGEKICWHYSKYVNITHCYTTENYMRSSLHNMKPVPEDAPDQVKRTIADRKYRWEYIFFEETAAFVRINPHLYVVTFIESQRNRMDTLQGGGDMVLTVNTRMMHDFGIGFSSGTGMPDFNLVSVHGDFDDVIVPFEVEQSPFHT